ncbi:MAG: hypothetical protein IPJ65_41430 [Archangiaceae bacterium]|nr:hypothetical protein [Archangiaceae bacterium]
MDFSVGFEFTSKSPGGATFGESIGFHYGESYSLSTTDTANFQGSVGDIPTDMVTEHQYRFGLFVYPEASSGQKFLVLNWWTQP